VKVNDGWPCIESGISQDVPGQPFASLKSWAFLSSKNTEAPGLGIALKLLVPKIKQKMPLVICLATDLHPVVGTPLKHDVATHLVKLTPRGCKFAETTLATMPTFVIYRAESISPAISEAKLPDIIFLELRVTKGIQKKREHSIVLRELHLRVRGVWLRIPVRV
jgi:hypothetical protein